MNQIINMVVRVFMRKVINKGVNAGIDYATSRGSKNGETDAGQGDLSQGAKDTGRKARQAAKVVRKIGRM
ncbi:MAG: hypothetical protein KUG69_08295 [Marinosulfonomonas sp.]|nr:hypothetical protein [Marinosulfonomonas sp.]